MHNYDSELEFTRKILKNFNIVTYVSELDSLGSLDLDLGLRRLLSANYNPATVCKNFLENCEERVLYCSEDQFYCRYFFMKLPNTSPKLYFFAGPYTFHNIDNNLFFKIQQTLSLPKDFQHFLKQYYSCIPYIKHDDYFQSIILLLASEIFEGPENFKIQYCDLYNDEIKSDYYSSEHIEPENRELLEQRYELENQLMQAVASGSLEKIQFFITGEFPMKLEQRFTSRLRSDKNYLIILNTLLRKAAESGSVHPLYLDDISSQFAWKIEQITNEEEMRRLYKEMIRKYCLTVKSYSVKGYSPIIRKVLDHVNLSFSEDLSLKSLSEQFSISSTYLSALFKKETGSTLTEYINKKRIEHSIFLLNTTDWRVQTIATACGIDDLNYFTRIFKKYMGRTPSEYRSMLLRK